MTSMGFYAHGHVRWAALLHQGAQCRVMVNGQLSAAFPLRSGLLQGSGASPLFWCIVLQPLSAYLSSLDAVGRIKPPPIPAHEFVFFGECTLQGKEKLKQLTSIPAQPCSTQPGVINPN